MKRYFIILLTGVLLIAGLGLASAQEGDLPLYEGPIFVDDVEADGDVVILLGHVLDINGNPVDGATVEIWQTDAEGVYDHLGDSSTADRDMNFQFYGALVTDEDGAYVFRTIIPGLYEPRPRHIHYKVKLDDQELLTSQFYFTIDTPNIDESILLDPVAQQLPDESTVLVTEKDIVVALDSVSATDDSLSLTTAQQEGPYYPLVTVADFDNDLVVVSEQEFTTEDAEMPEFTLLNLNTATADDFLTIPGVSDRMVREFEEYRPYISIAQFRREIGKYVDDDVVAGYEVYVYVPIDVNESDIETLKQLPGVNDDNAITLLYNAPYESNEAFLTELAQHVSAEELAIAPFYLMLEE